MLRTSKQAARRRLRKVAAVRATATRTRTSMSCASSCGRDWRAARLERSGELGKRSTERTADIEECWQAEASRAQGAPQCVARFPRACKAEYVRANERCAFHAPVVSRARDQRLGRHERSPLGSTKTRCEPVVAERHRGRRRRVGLLRQPLPPELLHRVVLARPAERVQRHGWCAVARWFHSVSRSVVCSVAVCAGPRTRDF